MIARRFRLSRRANDWTRFAQIVCSVTDVFEVIANREFLMRAQNTAQSGNLLVVLSRRQKNDICAMSRRAPELNRLPKA
jgi:hypothetical protein